MLTGQIATSEAYAMKNMRRTHQQLFDEAEKNVKALHDMGIKRVAGNIGTVFGCPIQGRYPSNGPTNLWIVCLISALTR